MFPPGNTPMVETDGILSKLECCNPSGSIKDRIAKYIIDKSEELGLLKPGMRIVEATSGNTGIALGAYGRHKGYKVTIIMPENMTEERKEILRALDVDLRLCSREGSFAEAATIRDELAKQPGWFNPDQFSNPLNVECHYRTTAGELLSQLLPDSQALKVFVAGVGTGGSLIGTGKRLREAFPGIRIIAVEPSESAVMSGGAAGIHGINGIGDGFIPAIAGNGNGGINSLIDEVITVSTGDAIEAAKYISERFGYCVGVSSGANYVASQKASKLYGLTATLYPDGYSKYVSMGLRPNTAARCKWQKQGPLIAGLESLKCR